MNIDYNQNYYGLLGISFNADQKTIKKTYYKLSFRYLVNAVYLIKRLLKASLPQTDHYIKIVVTLFLKHFN